jgi:Protein of unknown function (DUF2849)
MTAPQQQKRRVAGPVMVTANRLSDGVVIYCTRQGGWTADLAQAAIAHNTEDAVLLLAVAAEDKNYAVDPYVAPVSIEGEHTAPGNLRERIRYRGPTIALPRP